MAKHKVEYTGTVIFWSMLYYAACFKHICIYLITQTISAKMLIKQFWTLALQNNSDGVRPKQYLVGAQ